MNDRPHCLNVGACAAKTPGKHCLPCAARVPEVRARKAAAQQAALLDPTKLANRQAAARATGKNAAVKQKRAASIAKAFEDPAVRARHRAGCSRSMAIRMSDPAKLAILRKGGLEVGRLNLGRGHSPEATAKRAVKLRATHLSWCPEEYWDLNQKLKRQRKLLPERKRIIGLKVASANLAAFDHELAAAHLRRLTSVFRCDEAGRLNPVGTHWRYGSAVLDRTALINLALRKGARPEQLAA